MLGIKLGNSAFRHCERNLLRQYHFSRTRMMPRPFHALVTPKQVNALAAQRPVHVILSAAPHQLLGNLQILRLLSVAGVKYNSSEVVGELVEDILEQSTGGVTPNNPVVVEEIIEGIINESTKSAVESAGTEAISGTATEALVEPSEDLAKSSEGLATASSSGTEATVLPISSEGSEAVTSTSSNELILDFIPEKPAAIDVTSFIGEPTFESLGLATWWPSGRMQYFMENLHIGLELEWWQTIIITTLCVRLVVFPLVVKAQKNVALMNNTMPGMAKLQEKLTDARRRGDLHESAMLGQKLQVYMKEHNINPLKNMIPVFVQLPIFMSMFFGLRGMAKCPVESMETGGLWWFENLTMADPFYLLPIFTSTTLYLQLKLGADGASLDQMGPIGKNAMRVLPFVLIPLTMNFPAAVTFYWAVTNLISVSQARLIRLPKLRKTLGIPELIKWKKDKIPGQNKGFKQSVRETVDNWKLQGAIADRRSFDEQQFRDAGSAAPKKTYKFDPTKPINLQIKKKAF